MNIRSQLKVIIGYFNLTKRCGYTTAMCYMTRYFRVPPIVIVENERHAEQLQRGEPCLVTCPVTTLERFVDMQLRGNVSFDAMTGKYRPLVFDNLPLTNLLTDALQTIAQLDEQVVALKKNSLVLATALATYADMEVLTTPEDWDYTGQGCGPGVDDLITTDIGATARAALEESGYRSIVAEWAHRNRIIPPSTIGHRPDGAPIKVPAMAPNVMCLACGSWTPPLESGKCIACGGNRNQRKGGC